MVQKCELNRDWLVRFFKSNSTMVFVGDRSNMIELVFMGL